MPLFVLLAAAAVAAAVPLLVWSLAGDRTAHRETASRNLFEGFGVSAADARELLLAQSAADRALQPVLRWLAERGRRLTPAGWITSLDRRIALAGRPEVWTLERVLAAKLALAGFGIAFALLLVTSFDGAGWMLVAFAAPLAGYFAPDLVLYDRASKRRTAIERSLPDTLDQLTISVEAGLGFEAAMAHVGETGEGPLAEELVRTLQEVQVGVARSRALRDLADRTGNADLRRFATAVVQAESYGIPIAQVLRTQAGEMRVKRRQLAEERAQKMPVKLVFPLILCLLPALFVVIIGPGVIRISQTLFSAL